MPRPMYGDDDPTYGAPRRGRGGGRRGAGRPPAYFSGGPGEVLRVFVRNILPQ